MIVNINNLNINFEVYGSGKPLIILHGWGDGLFSWRSVALPLSKDFKVFLIDLPGFGDSEAPTDIWGVEEYSNTIAKLIEELELKEVTLFGHSMGGKIAANTTLKSKRVKKLILSGAAGMEKRNIATFFKIFTFKTLKLLFTPWGNNNKLLRFFVGVLGSQDYREAGKLRKTLVKVVNQKLHRVLPKIKIPTLIVWGEKDEVLPMTLAKDFQRLILNSQIKILWGVDHFPQFRDPEGLANAIINFVE